MVVFPAPSSPRMRILISRVPNKLEKMVEKKPPTKTRREKHFNVSQLCRRYAKVDRLTSFLTGLQDGFFLQWKKTSPGCCPDGCVLCAQQHYVLLVCFAILWFYGGSLQQTTLQQHQAFAMRLQFYFFPFSRLPKSDSSSFWLVSDSTYSLPETIQGPKEAWKNSASEDVYGLSHFFFS